MPNFSHWIITLAETVNSLTSQLVHTEPASERLQRSSFIYNHKKKILKFYNFMHSRCFRKTAKSDYKLRQVCPSVRMEQLGSH